MAVELTVRTRSTQISSRVSLCLLLLGAACTRYAVPVDPVAGILEAFHSHQIVALGEGGHGSLQAHAFRLALIHDARFPSIVNDVVVEFGNSRYQKMMDTFVQGGDVPHAELRRAWEDTTMPNTIWNVPIYEEFFRAVRDVNARLPPERQLRVLLGDPPIDWQTIRTHGEAVEWIGQRHHVIDVIEQEVLPRNRRALMIYGDGHLSRSAKWAGASSATPTLVNRLEQQGVHTFSIWTNVTAQMELMQRDIASWPVPSLTLLRDTRLGRLNFKYFAGLETEPPTTMEEQYDAVLYLGPVSSITWSELTASLCSDAGYTTMRLARMALATPGGAAGGDTDEFKKRCARFSGR
ncbi:MAG: hypothetical protein IT184_03200 [Acidobacteria bacterium]|nr:hypothetical protein [Acidobacteriota bacterium]